jgi:recombination protein RecA
MGSRTRAKVVKNKIAPPFKEAEFDIMYGEGISKVGELVDMGVKFGFVQKAGAWFAMGDTRLGQGRDAAKQFFRENPEIADEIEQKIKEKLTGKAQATPEAKTPAKATVKAAAKAEKPRASVEVFADDFEDD